MHDPSWLVLIFACLMGIYAVYLLLYLFPYNKKLLGKWAADEEIELDGLSIEANDARFVLNGRTAATVVRTVEKRYMEIGHVAGLTTTRYLRNASGEYFLWIWRSNESPFIKHISHPNAKIALRSKYVAPNGEA